MSTPTPSATVPLTAPGGIAAPVGRETAGTAARAAPGVRSGGGGVSRAPGLPRRPSGVGGPDAGGLGTGVAP
jgi:hypothetical protein